MFALVIKTHFNNIPVDDNKLGLHDKP